LIFLDESGVTTQMTRLYARCQGGGRIHEGAPEGHWKVLTTLGAMSLEGMVATMTVESAGRHCGAGNHHRRKCKSMVPSLRLWDTACLVLL